jgi:hypothetical protein
MKKEGLDVMVLPESGAYQAAQPTAQLLLYVCSQSYRQATHAWFV